MKLEETIKVYQWRLPSISRITLFTLIVVIFFTATLAQGQDPTCPEALSKVVKNGECDKIKCRANLKESECPAGTFYTEKLSFCGCCPGCAKFKGLPPISEAVLKEDRSFNRSRASSVSKKWADDCEGPACPIEFSACMPGLVCIDEACSECRLPSEPLDQSTEECMYKKSLFRLGLFHWDPKCNADGSYAAKQCKGEYGIDGLCFCVDPSGNRIFGREWRSDAENQTCACSRQSALLRLKGQISTLHCAYDGNYEPLQCDTDSGVCYCVNEQTGQLSGGIVPQVEWKSLPCFSDNITNFMDNGRYMRQCESYHAGAQSLLKEGHVHNTDVKIRTPSCDFDGSYAPIQAVGSRTGCVFKNGTTIRDYFTSVHGEAITCRCARDEWLYKSEGLPFSYQCGGDSLAGSYKTLYNFGTVASCVDTDGILYGDKVPSKFACCLDRSCSPPECYNSQSNPTGFRACCDWPFGGVCTTTEGAMRVNNVTNTVIAADNSDPVNI